MAQTAIVREVTHLVGLRHTGQSGSEFFAHEFTIAFVNHVEQRPADKLIPLKTEALQSRRVAPLEIPIRVNGVDRFTSTLENVVQQRLMLASHSLDLAQFGKIARRADHSQSFASFVEHRLDRYEQRTIQTLRCDLDRHAATSFDRVFNYARFILFTRTQDVATLPAEQQPRMNGFHCSTRAIHAFELAGAIEDENAVRHRVKRRFPLSLPARDHLEQLRLTDTDRKSLGERLNQHHFVFGPAAHTVRLVNTQHTATLSFDDQRVVDLRANVEPLRVGANVLTQHKRLVVVVQRIVDD